MKIEVECRFEENSHIAVRRIRVRDSWETVEQGRQWRDGDGQHILVIWHDQVYTLTLHPATLTWTIEPAGGKIHA